MPRQPRYNDVAQSARHAQLRHERAQQQAERQQALHVQRVLRIRGQHHAEHSRDPHVPQHILHADSHDNGGEAEHAHKAHGGIPRLRRRRQARHRLQQQQERQRGCARQWHGRCVAQAVVAKAALGGGAGAGASAVAVTAAADRRCCDALAAWRRRQHEAEHVAQWVESFALEGQLQEQQRAEKDGVEPVDELFALEISIPADCGKMNLSAQLQLSRSLKS